MVRTAKPLASAEPDSSLAMAVMHLREGRPGDAVPFLREAACLRPGNALVQHDLGLALLETGRAADALAAFERATAADPRYGEAFFRMGTALEKLGDFLGALRAYDRATELAPTLAEAWFRAGDIVYRAGRPREAVGCFRRAAEAARNSRFGRLGAARALLIEEQDDEAEKLLRLLLERDPGAAMAWDLLGAYLAERGRFEEAHVCFSRAIAIAPLMGGAYYDLVRCRTMTLADDDLIAQMEAALASPALEPSQRLAVHLARGKAAEDLSDYQTAMRHFDAADAVRRAAGPFDAAAFEIEADRLIGRFSAHAITGAAEKGHASASPIFIVGMPRSGTTLLEQILSSHPQIVGAGELNFWNERGAAWRQADLAPGDAPFLARAASDYVNTLEPIMRGAARVTDKMPFNFLWVGLIHLALPRAMFIHCRRASIDTALSIHQTLFHQGLAFPTGGPELVSYFRCYSRLVNHWRRVIPAGQWLDVDYEELTEAPHQVIPRIVAACGLTWDDACLRPEQNKRPVKTPSKWQTRQPINRGSVERWRRYEPWLGALRELLDTALLS